MLSATDWTGPAASLRAWRDHHPEAMALPGMALGVREQDTDRRRWVARLYDEGVRAVEISEPVDLCAHAGARSAGALMLVRELTVVGIEVRWRARCPDGCGCADRYGHLHPPQEVLGAPAVVTDTWRDTFFPCKCVFRRGPGFTEVRDRRRGTLEMFTIDEPRHLAAIEAMTDGVPVHEIAPDVLAELTAADLVAEHAGHVWWLPSRVHRWPFPPLVV